MLKLCVVYASFIRPRTDHLRRGGGGSPKRLFTLNLIERVKEIVWCHIFIFLIFMEGGGGDEYVYVYLYLFMQDQRPVSPRANARIPNLPDAFLGTSTVVRGSIDCSRDILMVRVDISSQWVLV